MMKFQLLFLSVLAVSTFCQAQDTIAIYEFRSSKITMNAMGGNHSYAYGMGENGPAEIGRRGKNLIPYFKAYPDALRELKKARRSGILAEVAGSIALASALLIGLNAAESKHTKVQARQQGVFLGLWSLGTTFTFGFDRKSRKYLKKSVQTYNSLVLKTH